MPLDPQARAVIDFMEQLGVPDFSELTPAEARAFMSRRLLPPGPEVRVDNRVVPGLDGEIPIRVYRPDESGPYGCLVFFHGGGFVTGDLDGHDALCRQICLDGGFCVVSVGYRLAPEHKFPAAPEDCYAATCWVSDNAASLDVDPTRIAVGGDSAGGNLAAVTCLLARERGGPSLVFQLLFYPVADMRSMDTQSYLEYATGHFLTRSSMLWFRDRYLQDESQRADPRVSLLAAADLRGLPPALVITAEYDPLRDEGEAYARALRRAGVSVRFVRYDGVIHAFVSFYALIDKGRQALEEAVAVLRKALGSG